MKKYFVNNICISDGGSNMPDILSAPGVFRVQVLSRLQFNDDDQDDFVVAIMMMLPAKMTINYGDKDYDNIDPSGIQLDSALQLYDGDDYSDYNDKLQ